MGAKGKSEEGDGGGEKIVRKKTKLHYHFLLIVWYSLWLYEILQLTLL